MTNKEKLLDSFSLAFPDLDRAAIPTATMESVPAWDSLATVNLITIVEENFGIAVPIDVLPSLHSFSDYVNYIEQQNGR